MTLSWLYRTEIAPYLLPWALIVMAKNLLLLARILIKILQVILLLKTCHGVGIQLKLEVEISHVEQKFVRCDICSPRMCDFGLAFEWHFLDCIDPKQHHTYSRERRIKLPRISLLLLARILIKILPVILRLKTYHSVGIHWKLRDGDSHLEQHVEQKWHV